MKDGMIDVWCMTFGEPLTDEEKDDVVSKALNRGKGTDLLSETPFVNSMATCDCSYCKAIREAKEAMTATKVIEQREAGIKKHAKAFGDAVDLLLQFDCGTEPTEFQGLPIRFAPIEPDLESEAVSKWLRDCEKAIAEQLGMSEAWIHVSINGDFLCSL